jgi:hypothetical protein
MPKEIVTNMNNQEVFANTMTSSKQQQQQDETKSTGIVDKARNFVHETVKTPERREEERQENMTLGEKIHESMPGSTKDAADRTRETLESAVQNVKDNFQDRLDEGKNDDNRIQYTDPKAEEVEQQKEKSFQPIKDLREKVYDATKSEAERKADQKAEMGVMGQIKADTKEINPFLTEEEKKQLP